MALVVADRVQETTSTTSTSDYVLLGAAAGYQSFGAVLANADTTYYAITNDTDWEVGIGTYSTTGPTLARTTILASSNGGAAVSWGVGVKNIFISYAASKSVYLDASGNLSVADKIIHTGDTNTAIRFPAADTVSIETGGTERFKVENSTITSTVPIVLPADPTTSLQAATKSYVDTIASASIHYHTPVRVESPTALTVTYNNGTSGVGATLTNAGTQAVLVLDGITLSVNDRVLIYTQADQTQNGVYTVTNVGSVSTNWVMTRSTDTNTYAPSSPTALGAGDAFFVSQGVTGAGELYVCNTTGTITFGTTNITFVQVAATAVYTAGTGISLTNNVITNTAPDQTVALTQGGATTITGTYPNFTISSTDTTYTAGGGIGLAGTTFSVAAGTGLTQDADGLSHADTSSQASVDNTGATFVQDITLDGFGHVTGAASVTVTPSLIGAPQNDGTGATGTWGISISGNAVNVTGTVAIANGGTGATTDSQARTNLGLAIGSNVQAYDAGLQSISGLTTSADQMIYTTASDTYATTSLTAAGRAILDDADAAAQRTTLGLGTMATQAASSVSITGGSISGITDLAVADGGTGASDAGTARTNLGLAIGSNVQAWDANLDQIAALAPTADNFIVGNGTAWTLETPANALASLGVTATAAELNYVDGVTSAIQTQIDAKAALASPAFTGQASFADGTAAAPSITHTGDLNAGLFFPAADTVAVATAGSERMRIESTGNISAGSSTTSINFDIGGNISLPAATTADRFIELGTGRTGNANAYIDFVGDATYTDFGLRIIRNSTGANANSAIAHRGTGGLYLTAQDAGVVGFQTTNTTRFIIGPLGQFGIGGATYGTAGQVLTSGGSGAAPSWGNLVDYQVFTATGTWTKPSGISADAIVYFHIIGGGAGGTAYFRGSGTLRYVGGGSGGGGYIGSILASALGATVSVTVGAAGISRTASGSGTTSTGGSGGASSFGSFIAGGGVGGGSSSTAGSVTSHGFDGHVGGDSSSDSSNQTSINSIYGGGGGGSGFSTNVYDPGVGYIGGGNGGAQANGNNAVASAGSAPGGGGGAAHSSSTSTSGTVTSGAGARGEVRVWTIG